jgi:hypothetical protein
MKILIFFKNIKKYLDLIGQKILEISTMNNSNSNLKVFKDDDIIHLNIGGTFYTTSFQTLTQKINGEENFFSTMLSGKYTINEDKNGNIFIDRDGTHFKYILNYLRELGAEDEIVLLRTQLC